jgi:hypothetical protein
VQAIIATDSQVRRVDGLREAPVNGDPDSLTPVDAKKKEPIRMGSALWKLGS